MEQIAKLQEEQEAMAETLKTFQRKVNEEKSILTTKGKGSRGDHSLYSVPLQGWGLYRN